MIRPVCSEKMSELPTNRAIVLKNLTCPYCNADLTVVTSTKEHVVGRRFVPKGALDGEWNLILQACAPCNSHKSHLENDISAITQYVAVWANKLQEDDAHAKEARRKAASAISDFTRKPVSKSEVKFSVKGSVSPGVAFSFEGEAPPQVADQRLYELARLQLMAFFYFVTFNESEKKGHFWVGGFFPVLAAQKANWGNGTHWAFMRGVVDWEPRFRGWTANEHFGVIIRRHPGAKCRSWALEWNQQYRLVGFFGEQHPCSAMIKALPVEQINVLSRHGNDWFGVSIDTPLPEGDDALFSWLPQSSDT